MPGIKALRKVQLGKELTAGTAVDCTAIWRGTGVLTDNRETIFADENVGILGSTLRTYVPKTGGEIELASEATFEQLGYLFQSGIYLTTPTTDASSAQIWTWNLQSESTDAIQTTDLQTVTVRGGDNQEVEKMAYCFTRSIGLSGNAGEAVQMTGVFEGRTVTTDSFSTGITLPSVEEILTSKCLLYIDPSTDTAGTTVKSNTLLSFDLSFTTGWQAVYTAGAGDTYFSFIKRTGGEDCTLNITFEHDGVATAEKDAWRNESERVIRLKFLGSGLTTTDAGAPYDTKTLVLDMYGKWESFESLSDQDGNDTVSGTFRVGYSSAATKKLTAVLVNELASLP